MISCFLPVIKTKQQTNILMSTVAVLESNCLGSFYLDTQNYSIPSLSHSFLNTHLPVIVLCKVCSGTDMQMAGRGVSWIIYDASASAGIILNWLWLSGIKVWLRDFLLLFVRIKINWRSSCSKVVQPIYMYCQTLLYAASAICVAQKENCGQHFHLTVI